MATDLYRRLAQHLDNLPGGFPATESGVELRILQRLFTPEEAELALSLALLPEEPRVVARRAGIPTDEAAARLAALEKKGLIYSIQTPGKTPQYSAQHFVVGIWEFQVKNLTPELIHDFEEYRPSLFNADAWKKVPQLRTIPVGEAVDARLEVLAYERAEAIVMAQERFTVAPCICRQEKHMLGEGCDKPLETCVTFGMAADFYARNGQGRPISKEEALGIVKEAEKAGLVLSPSNAQEPMGFCACCGCCCGVLRTVKDYPKPGSLVASAFVAQANAETCQGCGTCIERCPMEAVWLDDGKVVHDPDRCIGCGLCVTTCPSESLSLQRKPKDAYPPVPKNIVDQFLKLGQARGKLTRSDLVAMMARSKADRLLARK